MISRTSSADSRPIDATAAAWIARRDAGLSEGEQAEFDAWREADPRHAQALQRFNTAWAALGRARRTGGAADLASELSVLERRQRDRRRRALGAAAAFMLLFGMAWWVRQNPPAHESALASAPTTLLLPETQTLSDGTIVEFPPGTRISIDYNETARRITLLQGDALFHVTKDARRPFLVNAGGVEVRAVGTAFAVQMSQAEVEVLVTEGKVEVSHVSSSTPGSRTLDRPLHAQTAKPSLPDARSTPAAIPIDSGNRIVLERDAASAPPSPPPVLKVVEAEIAAKLAWRQPRVEFSGAPLREVVALLNRHNEVQFVIDDAALETVKLSGLFRATDTEAIVRLLEAGFGIKADRQGRAILLRKG